MFHDSLTDFESQIETGKIQVALFELLDDSKRMQVVVKPVTVRAHQFIELPLARVPERWVSDVVHQGQRFGKFRVEPKRPCYGPGNLCDLDRVREPVPEVIGIPCREDLRL